MKAVWQSASTMLTSLRSKFKKDEKKDEPKVQDETNKVKLLDDACSSSNSSHEFVSIPLDNVDERNEIFTTEEDERDKLMRQIAEKTKTLKELHEKVMDNKAENLTLMRESEELNKYIDKLMKKSSTFEPLAK